MTGGKNFLEGGDIFEIMAKNKSEADAKIKPWQAQLKKGDCFCYLSAEIGLVVWGQVLEDQTDEVMRGYRYCNCYSAACPDGEDGDVHVSVVHKKVSPAVFEKARLAGWPHDEETFVRFASQIAADRSTN